MAIPNFDTIADAEIDPDSPITTGLLNKYRNRDDHLEEWLGKSFVAAEDHDHDGVNSKGIFVGTAVFDLSRTGAGVVNTGALSFVPKIVIAVGTVTGNSNSGFFIGFATGTGALAKSIAAENVGSDVSSDADAIGGEPANPGGGVPATAHFRDLDVTTFQKASPGIELTAPANIGTIEVKLLVFGFSAS